MLIRLLLLASLATAALTGCYNPDLGENPFKCTEDPNACPEGYICHQKGTPANWVCKTEIPPDLGPPDLGPLPDGFFLPKKEGFVYLDRAMVKPAPAGCADASSEPNNSGSTATGLFNAGLINGWEICYAGDVDQYTIKVEAGKKLTVLVDFTQSKGSDGGDLDAALVGPDGYVTPARSKTDDETLTVTNTTASPETYILGVWGFDGATNTYDLKITLE